MKYLHKISLLLSIFAVGLFASCDKDNEGAIYTSDNAGVKFQVAQASISLNPDDTGTSVYLFRADASSDITVGLESALISEDGNGNEVLLPLPEGISVPSSITFPAGQGSVQVPITVGDVELGATYALRISLTDTSYSPSIAPQNSVDVSVMKDYVWESAGTLHIVSEWMGGYEWDDILQKAQGTSTLYRAYYIYTKGYSLQFWIEGNKVTVKPHVCDTSDYGDVWAEGEGTFENGVATITIEYFIPGLGTFGTYTEIITIP